MPRHVQEDPAVRRSDDFKALERLAGQVHWHGIIRVSRASSLAGTVPNRE
jgi:hypothetical protein